MSLPYDYARCHGGASPLCVECLRRTSPWGPRQSVITNPPVEGETCHLFVAPKEAG